MIPSLGLAVEVTSFVLYLATSLDENFEAAFKR
jgi:hypothetical protein